MISYPTIPFSQKHPGDHGKPFLLASSSHGFLQSVDWSGYVGYTSFLRAASQTPDPHPVADAFSLKWHEVSGLYPEPGLPGLVVVGYITLPCCLWVPGNFGRPQS